MSKPKFRLHGENADFFYDFMLVDIEKKFPVAETREIQYGKQLILENGSVVNLYHTAKFSTGGKENRELISLIPKLIRSFFDYLELERKSEAIAIKYKP